MRTSKLQATLVLFLLAIVNAAQAEDKPVAAKAGTPLKVYVLAGQSNMDGHVSWNTIDAMRNDPEVAELYKDMTDKDGNPITVEDVYVKYGDASGKLTNKFGAKWKRGQKMGPEYTFGIYMHKRLKEPFLIIKTAWGGRNLLQQFRSPSAGPFEKEVDGKGNKTGYKYRQMVKEVNDVLADPGKYHPAYDKTAGYEIAGFVWFQGYNDMINSYYQVDRKDRRSPMDYSEYTRLMACFIRDVRKDLSAPDMPFVIGAIGIGGDKDQKQVMLAKAQGATADIPEFKGNVGVVYTAKYWDHKLGDIFKSSHKTLKLINRMVGGKKKAGASKDEQNAYRKKLTEEKFSDEEREMKKGISNEPYHYLGSAKIVGRIGKAFADAMLAIDKK